MNLLDEIKSFIVNNQLEEAYNLIIKNEESFISNSVYWNLRGVLCLKVQEYQVAINCFETALTITPTDGDIYYNYGYALEKIGATSDSALYYGLSYRYSQDEALKAELISMFGSHNILRNIFNTSALGKDKTFILLSSCAWGDVYQRMHHIARALVKFGHEVIYISPSISATLEKDNISNLELITYSKKNLKVVDGVKVYSPITVFKNQEIFANNYIDLVQSLMDSSRFSEKVVISYMPYQINIIKSLIGDFYHIYECVDDHTDLTHAFWGSPKDVIWEQELMDNADAITTTATSLFLQRLSVEGRNNVYMSRNAVNEQDFIETEKSDMPTDLINIPEPRIVFTGVVYSRFDEELFYKVVETNPDKSFVIIGPIHDGMLTRKYDNLYLLGPKKHSDLQTYLKYMRIGIVPYIDHAEMDIACDSIKQYEYIASNLPVITTHMPESGINKVYTFLADNKDSFNNAINKCLTLTIDNQVKRDFLAINSWNERASLLCRLPDNLVKENEKKQVINDIGESINFLSYKYKKAIYLSLQSLYEFLENKKDFGQAAHEAYKLDRLKFVEKQYLWALFKKRDMSTFYQVVLDSPYIKEEIKSEFKYRYKTGEKKCVQALSYLCIGDIKSFQSSILDLDKETNKILYRLFLNYIINGSSSGGIESLIEEENSPLYHFLKASG